MMNTFATPRTAVIDRVTSESSIHLELNLDGTGKNDISTWGTSAVFVVSAMRLFRLTRRWLTRLLTSRDVPTLCIRVNLTVRNTT